MKKKLFVFLTTLALLLSMVMPAYADELLNDTYFENGNGQEQYENYGSEPDDTYTDDYALYEVPDDEMESQPYDEYNKVVDAAYLLSDSEFTALTEKLNEICERQQFDIVIVTVDDLQGYATAQELADDIYDYNGYGFGENNDGCLLLISLEDNDWYISTTGYGITALTDAGIQYIGKQITPDLGDGDWAGAFNLYADLIDEFVTQAKNGESYDNGNLPHSILETIKAIIISLVIGVACAAITMVNVKKKYTKAVHMNANAQDYLVNGSLQVTGSYDNFVYTNVTRTEIPKETSSSGSSTHSGSSGTTHGGGGGKF